MENLVSVIIPCFNAERWLKEAIDSCIHQTYPNLEVIVVDDGSTDRCLEIIKSYGDQIIWESGTNKGGNHARNRGFALSKGEYIQYLDADDYLLPEKIETQVHCLEETKANVAYSDWRHKHHSPDGTTFLDKIQVSGPKGDFLELLLLDEQWIPPVALLFTREIIAQSNGWDELLKAGQDRDFLISITISGAKFAYQPGCHSIYRRYSNTTVSTFNKKNWRDSHFLLMEKAENRLTQLNQLSESYRKALAQSYFDKLRPARVEIDYPQYLWILRKILSLYPEFKTESTTAYNLVQRIFGFMAAEIGVKFLKQLRDHSASIVQ